MPMPHALFSAELDLLRDSDFHTSMNLAYCPQTVVLTARVNGGIASGVFAQVNFDTVTVGADTDVRPGMTVYFSTSTDIRGAYLTTRVRKTPTSSILYIAEAASVIQDNDFIIVVSDYWLWEKLVRFSGGTTSIDWDVTFKKPAPLIGNLQSVYIDPRPTGDGTFTFSPTGIPMAQDATTTMTWLWDVDDGTITVGTTTTQRITATFPQGERWISVTVTDSNGVTGQRVIWVNVGLTNTLVNIDNPPVTGSLEDGWNLSLNTWDFQGQTKLRALPENTLCVLYTIDTFADGTHTPIVTNIVFIGRTRSETGTTIGDQDWSTLQTGSFELEGFASQLNRLSSPQLTITHDTTPTAWGEVNRPTVPRLIGGHLCSYFNTLSTICSLDFEIPFTLIISTTNADATVTVTNTDILRPGMGVSGTGIPGGTTVLSITDATTFELSANATATSAAARVFTPERSDQRFISQSLSITETSAGAALDKIASWINAKLNYAASGEIYIRRHAWYLAGDQSDLATVADINDGTTEDTIEYTISIEYPDKIGRAFAGSEFFNTTLGKTKYLTGSAPPVARGNGEGQAQEDGQILTADSTEDDAETELNGRVAVLYAMSQPVDKIEVLFHDAWRGVFVPSDFHRWTFTIASANNIMGRIYTTSQHWICVAVAYNVLLESGESGNKATFLREPPVGAAQATSAIVPALIEPAIPDLPAYNPYPGMELSGGINYGVDGVPDIEDLQPIDSYSGSLGDELAANNFPPPGCRSYQIMLNDSTGITTPSLTNTATYTVRAQGFGQIATGGLLTIYDDGNQPPDFDLPAAPGGGTWTSINTEDPTGFIEAGLFDPTGPDGDTAWIIMFCDIPVTLLTNVRLVFDENTEKAGLVQSDAGNELFTEVPASIGGGEYAIDIAYASHTGNILALNVRQHPTGTTTAFRLIRMEVTTAGGDIVMADAYYYFDPNNINVGYPYTGFGLTFDGLPPNTIPPYNTNHLYDSTITGDGSAQVVKFSDTDYSDNAASAISVQICGAGL